ncbi:gamma-glutamyl hydrolase-like [Diabrotica undecimpunctata]|uniref:gamma-glutamyl hydrolase-like n=1 Tax=Diabrotica undecimpunctata TaxID=50387 RepID=UPI003B63CDBB
MTGGKPTAKLWYEWERTCYEKHLVKDFIGTKKLGGRTLIYNRRLGRKIRLQRVKLKKEYYEKVVSYTNGIFFPGGGTYFNETDGYGEAARQIYNLAVELDNKGIYYPVWGICLGMQALVFSQLGTDIRIDRILKNVAVSLEYIEDYEKSKMYSRTPKQLIQILGAKNVTYNCHRYGLTEDVLRKHEILDDWNILTTNKDARHLRFISLMESKKYPIYGLQFHPEKNIHFQ